MSAAPYSFTWQCMLARGCSNILCLLSVHKCDVHKIKTFQALLSELEYCMRTHARYVCLQTATVCRMTAQDEACFLHCLIAHKLVANAAFLQVVAMS